jgi:FtsP/CotA-like multicopper oxidase with cupredoxin domain
MRNGAMIGFAAGLVSLLTPGARSARHAPPAAVVPNDNRTPSGQLRHGVLELHLELRDASWYPESDTGAHFPVYVFAEAGGPPESPGPLIRVPVGTEIHASLRNTLSVAAKVYGLHQHPGDPKDALSLAPGESRDVRFTAGTPGTYLYWAAVSDHTLDSRDQAETMLSGAFVIDSSGAKPTDRIFVLGLWSKGDALDNEIPSVNGKSWPYDEHLTYRTGETIHWRVLNPTASPHAMHMHGFYFDVDGVGDGDAYDRYASDQRRKAATELIEPGHVFDVTWSPDRIGNWLFHCHMVAHMSPSVVLHPPSAQPTSYAPGHGHGTADQGAAMNTMMGGLVIGITVVPASHATAPPPAPSATHTLQLVLSETPNKVPFYSLEVHDPAAPAPARPVSDAPLKPGLVGPPIVLTRGETAAIEVENHTSKPTSIHWHGIEIESYYDGVVGWTGTSDHPSPVIPPGGSFVAQMTPPRAGTFIYHTHWHDVSQIRNGVYGPLIVLPPGQKYDPEHDLTFTFGVGNYAPFGFVFLVNGNPQPDPVTLHAGTRYRMRLINITSNAVDMRVRLTRDDAPVQWTIVAKDGADLPPAQVKSSVADMWLTVGETYDVEYEATTPGLARLAAWEVAFPKVAAIPLDFVAAHE